MQQAFSHSKWYLVWGLLALMLLSIGLSGCGGGSTSNSSTFNQLATGSWGGSANGTGLTVIPATLVVTASGGQMTIACQGLAQYNGTVLLGSAGQFSVIGTSTPCCTATLVPTRFDGVVANNVMTLTLTDTNSNVVLATYTLKLGQVAPAQAGVCPG